MIISTYLKYFFFGIFVYHLSSSYVLDNSNLLHVNASYYSYYKRDPQGGYILHNGKPFHSKGQREVYTSSTLLTPKNTALIIIDPWSNAPSTMLNKESIKLIKSHIAPLVWYFKTQGYPVYLFSNNCNAIKPTPYSCNIAEPLKKLMKYNKKISLQYWQGFDKQSFAESLKKQGITQLIYVGFDSNMCVLTRPAGLVNMQGFGFKLYFIPEASSAIELSNTQEKKAVHKYSTIIIAQSIAKIIHYNDIMTALKQNQNNIFGII